MMTEPSEVQTTPASPHREERGLTQILVTSHGSQQEHI